MKRSMAIAILLSFSISDKSDEPEDNSSPATTCEKWLMGIFVGKISTTNVLEMVGGDGKNTH